MKKTNMQKGITLVALIITIVVLLLIAVVAIGAVRESGIIDHAKNAQIGYEEAKADEKERLLEYEYQLALSQGTFTGSYEEFILNQKYTGLKIGDKVNYTVDGYSGEWRVLGIENGQVLLVATTDPTTITFGSGIGDTHGVWNEKTKSFKNAEDELDSICANYLNSTYATKARSIRIEDIDKITGYDKTTYGTGTYKYLNVVTYSIDSNEKVAYSSLEGSWTSEETTFKIPQTPSNITEPYTVTSTYYEYDIDQETALKSTNSNVYKMLFGKNDEKYYLLASSCAKAENGVVDFGLRVVSEGKTSLFSFWKSDGVYDNIVFGGVRPVVYLESDIKLTETAANSGVWNIGE